MQRQPSIHPVERLHEVVQVVATHNEAPPGPIPLDLAVAPDSDFAASFRVLHHRLRRAGDPRVVAVTSPARREGKTTCAINLAMAMAEHGRDKVMLLEANTRAPRIAEALGFAPPVCFSSQLEAAADAHHMTWRAVSAFFPNLHVLAVSPETESRVLITAPPLKRALEEIRASDYAYVVIDCPPALKSADVTIIEELSDGLILTAMAGTTTRKSLERAAEHLAPAEILGVVLTNAKNP